MRGSMMWHLSTGKRLGRCGNSGRKIINFGGEWRLLKTGVRLIRRGGLGLRNFLFKGLATAGDGFKVFGEAVV